MHRHPSRFAQRVRLLHRHLPALVLLGAIWPAHGQTSTATFTVTATVLPTCTVVGGVPLAFGVVTPGTQRDGSVTVSATCTLGTPYTLALDAGTGSGATVARAPASTARSWSCMPPPALRWTTASTSTATAPAARPAP